MSGQLHCRKLKRWAGRLGPFLYSLGVQSVAPAALAAEPGLPLQDEAPDAAPEHEFVALKVLLSQLIN